MGILIVLMFFCAVLDGLLNTNQSFWPGFDKVEYFASGIVVLNSKIVSVLVSAIASGGVKSRNAIRKSKSFFISGSVLIGL